MPESRPHMVVLVQGFLYAWISRTCYCCDSSIVYKPRPPLVVGKVFLCVYVCVYVLSILLCVICVTLRDDRGKGLI